MASIGGAIEERGEVMRIAIPLVTLAAPLVVPFVGVEVFRVPSLAEHRGQWWCDRDERGATFQLGRVRYEVARR